MDQANNSILSRVKSWFVDKWKWILGIFAGLLALSAAFYRRESFYKKNFQNLKTTTEEEKKITETAAKKLVDQTENIVEDSNVEKKDIIEKNKKAEEDLKKDKEAFLDESRNSDTLAEDIAKELGVELVKTK